jgi:hypothetical protein
MDTEGRSANLLEKEQLDRSEEETFRIGFAILGYRGFRRAYQSVEQTLNGRAVVCSIRSPGKP